MVAKEKLKQVQVLERVRKILFLLASRRDPYTMHEIAEETDIHMSTAHRLLWNLAEDGFVERDENVYPTVPSGASLDEMLLL